MSYEIKLSPEQLETILSLVEIEQFKHQPHDQNFAYFTQIKLQLEKAKKAEWAT